MTHIAGLPLVVNGRYCRQLCAWCGEVLGDYDLERCASIDGSGPSSWEEGAYVRVDGNCSYLVPDPMPDDCCAMLEVTRPIEDPK